MKVRTSFETWIEGIRQLATAININADGQTGTVTLTANSASTTLTDHRITPSSVIGLMPTTANAATAIATTYIGTSVNESATITHANTATTDRIFKYSILS